MERSEFMAHLETVLSLDQSHDPAESMRPVYAAETVNLMQSTVQSDLAASSTQLQLKETIATGGMGLVRAATQHDLHREVAVKTVRPDKEGEVARHLLRQEAFVTGGLEHPNILPIYAMGEDMHGGPVIVMKRVEGHSWLDVLADPALAGAEDDDLLDWHLGVFMQVCSAVHFAHSRHILHRDIKPANVMLGSYDEVYLLDWGVATQLPDGTAEHLPRPESKGAIAGTPQYMAPEMTVGEASKLTAYTDVYLLGATLYHVLCGSPPHHAGSLVEALFKAHNAHEPVFAAGVPPQLAAICRRAMAADPDQRFESADTLRRAIAEFRSHRVSISLTDEAERALVQVRSGIEAGAEARAVETSLVEAHFGFRQALRVWRENVPAQHGLSEVLERMFEQHITARNLAGCRAVLKELAELGPTDPQLEERLVSAETSAGQRDAEFDRLREMERESDIRGSARWRFRAAAFTCVLWTLAPLSAKFMHEHTPFKMTSASFAQQGPLVLLAMVIIIWVIRNKVFENRANRRVSAMIVALCLYIPLFRLYAWVADIGPFIAWALEMLGYAVAFTGVALLTDYRILLAALIYAVGSGAAAASPEHVFEINAAANALSIAWLARIWMTQSDDDS